MMHTHITHAATPPKSGGGNDRLAAGPWDHPTHFGHLGCAPHADGTSHADEPARYRGIAPGLTASRAKPCFAAQR